MNFIILMLAAYTAYYAYKSSSPVHFAGATALLAAGFTYNSDMGVGGLIWLLVEHWGRLLVFAALGYGVAYWALGKQGKLVARTDAVVDFTEMSVMVGRVLDTENKSTVFSNTSIGKDVLGNLEAKTTHDVRMSHSTWMHDLTAEKDVHYSGSGELQARPGHILGTMSWSGRSLLDINFTTDNVFSVTAGKVHPAASAVMGFIHVLLGALIFPVGLLFPILNPKSEKGFFVKNVAPGTKKMELMHTLLGCVVFLIALGMSGDAIAHQNFGALCVIWAAVYVILTVTYHRLATAVKARYLELLDKGEYELRALYSQAEAKYTARAAAQNVVAEQVVSTVALAPFV